jgi:Protein of unknown function (DUF3631)/Domain of unknown function (DUF3854)
MESTSKSASGHLLAQAYLAERGITDETARIHELEFDVHPSAKKVYARLERSLPKGVNEVIWIPFHDAKGQVTWVARILPTIGKSKFLCRSGSDGAPYISKQLYGLDYGKPLIMTEGPIKTLACEQAGVDAIGLNGVWCAGVKDREELVRIRRDLQEALDWRGRKVYLAFDADYAVNPLVRQAQIRLFFILTYSGAEVFQLTWDLSAGKGIDDYLANGKHNASKLLADLIAKAKPFDKTLTPTPLDLGLVICELNSVHLPPALRTQLRAKLAKALGVHVDDLEQPEREAETQPPNEVILEPDPEPWEEEVDGDALLAGICGLIKRHIIVPESAIIIASVWAVLTYLTDEVDTLPNLALLSPDKRCGKTRFLDVLELLVRRPLGVSNISTASVFRVIQQCGAPTLLIDEADTFMDGNEELRGVLNSGHTRRKAYVLRTNRDTGKVERFSSWAPKAISRIGKLPETLKDRSIPIHMERKKKTETVSPLRETTAEEVAVLRRKIQRWVNDHREQIRLARPEFPQYLYNRDLDNWLPLIAVAEAVGSAWKENLSRAIASMTSTDDSDDDSVRTVLLLNLRALFKERIMKHNVGVFEKLCHARDILLYHIPTDEILEALNNDKETPWASWRKGEGLTAEKLKSLLKPYGVKPVRPSTREGRELGRGYTFGSLCEVFERYLKEEKKEDNPTQK